MLRGSVHGMLVCVSNKPATSQQHTPQIPAPGSPTPATAQGRGALAVHAVIYLLFGLSTIFIQTPDWGTDRLLIGGLLLALGASHWWASRGTRYGPATSATLISVALVQAASGALLIAQPDAPAPILLATCGGIGLGALLKGLLGARYRSVIAAARDWVLEGAVMLAAALAVPFMANIGPKAVLGVTGGGALIAGVFLLVGALGARTEGTPGA